MNQLIEDGVARIINAFQTEKKPITKEEKINEYEADLKKKKDDYTKKNKKKPPAKGEEEKDENEEYRKKNFKSKTI